MGGVRRQIALRRGTVPGGLAGPSQRGATPGDIERLAQPHTLKTAIVVAGILDPGEASGLEKRAKLFAMKRKQGTKKTNARLDARLRHSGLAGASR